MEFSIATLLTNFADDKLVAPKVLEKKLGCQDDASLRKLQVCLDALEKIGILTKDRGRYKRVTEEGVVEGKLRCSSKGFCFAIQDVEGSEDIYIRESQLSTAWNGDRVLVRITKEGSRRRSPEGEVRLILERANSSVLARVRQTETESFRAVPLDDRLLFEIELLSNGVNLAEAIDHLVNVEVQRYPLGRHLPIGRVTQVLGSDAQSAADTDIVCCKYDLRRIFSPGVLQEATALTGEMDAEEIESRLDLRDSLTIALKPKDPLPEQNCDDALTLEKTEDGHWQLGIHIADVAYYVEPDSLLDLEAQKRGTSVYLGDTHLPMLPEDVAHLCSFTPGQDRLAVSVLFTLDAAGQILEYELQPTIICLDYQLSYEQAQAILERHGLAATAEAGEEEVDGVAIEEETQHLSAAFEILDQLFALSQTLRAQRQQRGAFELNLPDTRFHYDDEGALGAMVVSSSLFARLMVVEFMMLANQAVAAHLQALGVPGIYRVHPTPNLGDVQELMKLASNMGIDLQLEQEDNIRPRDYQKFVQQFAESRTEKVLTLLLLETLKPAVYNVTPRPHFGLALEQGYTHFTAPMRRYPDLLVHRVLQAVFSEGRDRRTARTKDTVNLRHSSCHGKINWNVLPPELHQEFEAQFVAQVIHLSEREKIAQEAEEDLEGLKKAGFMKAHTGEIFQGLITGVQSYGFFVEIEDLLVEGLVHVSSLKDDWYEYRSRQQKLVGRKNRKQYRLGDQVEVQVKSVDYYRQQIDLIAVGGGSEASDEDGDEGQPVGTDLDGDLGEE
ncbi:iron ABC transporter substrate-binding protein [Leptolyngbya sp. 'hensonii']|uniref:ribonuclease R family protein n=1 Tax=Leptolyngbya sp. 'hensonii' TaxID=1922337 RepID=UPI0009500D61|nr:ribonuclease R family protein [Leptolyngbya sp. 'hensonii']OLP16165.1 iron ABC transporter substrate-binding protein [Leptolyngbya sp. 'hensonii']